MITLTPGIKRSERIPGDNMVIVDFGQTAALQPSIERGLIGLRINDPEQPIRVGTPALFRLAER